jgi:acyl-homoserine lactone acylase PvdQ
MDLKANTSNNTVYGQRRKYCILARKFYPREKKLNWSKVMDGTTATTQWKGLHDVLETVHSYNPENGWLQNCNSACQ